MNSHYSQIITKNLSNNVYLNACDSENIDRCHTHKVNCNHKQDKKSSLISNCNNQPPYLDTNRTFETKDDLISSNEGSKIDVNNSNEDLNRYKIKENNNSYHSYIQEKNSSLMDEKYFIPVTPSHENCHTESNQKQNIPKELVGDILKIIRDEHGQIALNYVLQSACEKSSIVKEFLKNEKLTARDSRKVSNIFVEINRHPNIKVVKKKPQLVVKWIEQENGKEALVNN